MSDRYPQYLSSQEPTAGIQHTAYLNPTLALNRIPAEEIARMAPADQALDRNPEPPTLVQSVIVTVLVAGFVVATLAVAGYAVLCAALGGIKARPVGAAKAVALVSLKCLIGLICLASAFMLLCILSFGGAQ